MNEPNQRQWYPARQRTIVLTFETPEQATAWDVAGRPLNFHETDHAVDIEVDP